MVSLPQTAITTHSKILIVEDEGIIANAIASHLAKAGYEVAGIADSSEEAFAKIAEARPDLILMDIRISGDLDGIETATRLRERFDVPVIYLTAHSDRQTIDRAKVTGAFGFLTKPIQPTNLVTSIEMAIHKHRSDLELRRQRAWMATVLAAMADGIAVIDSDSNVQFLNPPAEKLTGWLTADALGRDVALVLSLTDSVSGLAADEFFSVPSDPQPARQMPRGLLARTRAGHQFPIEGEIAPSVDGRKYAGAVVTFRDATVRQAQEQEMRHEYKMRAIGRLAGGLAHDFNNLLFIINGYSEELLDKAALNERDMRSVTQIKKAGETAAGITQQLLRFGRKGPIEKQDLRLNDVIRDTEHLFRRLAGPSIDWQIRLDPNLGIIRGDQGQLKQVLMNLVANARDAMSEAGEITIETTNLEIASPGSLTGATESFIALSVTDTGAGMSKETAEQLFEPFFTTKGPGKGTGLGLSIVHSIVTDLGGAIQVETKQDKGTTFTIYIPRSGVSGIPIQGDVTSDVQPTAQTTILLVEDHEGVRYLIRSYLENLGCRVLEAKNGEEAIDIASRQQGQIDLLITDVVMPKASGFQVARELSAARKGMKTLFISGYAEELIGGRESLPLDAQFLSKPFIQRDFLRQVSDLLRRVRQ